MDLFKRRSMGTTLLNPLFLLIGLLILIFVPYFISDFQLKLLAKFLTFAIAAIGLDLIWGYGGMLSLGQGLFFSLGGYSLAMYLKLENSGDRLPDFMVWSGITELPGLWEIFRTPTGAILMMLIVPSVVAFLIGYLIFRSRVEGVYFSIITQALTLIGSLLFVGYQQFTGGTNGITNLPNLFGYSRSDIVVQRNLYWITLLALVFAYLLCRYIANSRFGRLLVATRDDEDRVRFLGYNPVIVKTFAFVISAILAAIAGALYVTHEGNIAPSLMGVVPSIEMVIMVAVGGRATIIGAIVGALAVNYANRYMAESFPETWQFLFGLLFVGVVLLFPKGIMGTIQQLLKRNTDHTDEDLESITDPSPLVEGAISHESS